MMRRLSILISIFGIAGLTAWANPDDDSRIARISYLDGYVSFQHPNEVDWSAASINMALQPEDRLYTGDNGRAEIQFDDGSVLRLAEKTDVEILVLREDLIQARVLTGLCTLTVQSSLAFEIDTPAAAFDTLKKGIYRFDVTDSGDTDGIVRKGRMDAANSTFSRRIDSGELIHVTPGDDSTNLMSRYESRDTWDDWTDRRDAELIANESRRYLPDNVYYGARELDQYGRWVVVDSYGPAWVPYYVDTAWSPYWDGRWCYRPYWGWTWVSYEPWGWLPYHYGRWYHHAGFGWCWLPGPSFGFHFWSPGLVRFYEGPSWVSWCPLGPGDYYNVNHYTYRSTYNYQINNIRLIQNRAPDDLVNRNVPGAFRTVSTSQFVGSGPGGTVRTMPVERVDQPWRQGRMITDKLEVSPNARSFQPAPERPTIRPNTISNLPAVVRNVPGSATLDRRSIAPIGASSAVSSRPVVRSVPGNVSSGGRTGGDRPSVAPNNPEGPSTRGNPANPPRVYQVPAPVTRGRSATSDNQNTGNPPARQPQPSPSMNENQRSRPPATPRTPSPSYSPPERRMPVQPAPAPRNDRPAPAPRPESDRSRPHSSASMDTGYTGRFANSTVSAYSSYTPRATTRQYDSRPTSPVQATPPVGRYQQSYTPRPAPLPPTNFGGGSVGAARPPAPSYSAPAASGNWGSPGRGTASPSRTPSVGGNSHHR